MFTVGHSTRTLDELTDLVRSHGVDLVADVRKMPRSRRHPQFDAATLPAALAAGGLGYTHLPGLGGFRRERPDSVNRAWRNPSFRAYADYMQTPEFAAELERLLGLGRARRVAIMCAEAYWLRCHRSLIADALVARGETVLHIVGPDRAEPHRLRDFARVDDGRVSYPGEPELF
ncbi:MAG TPA: DUF488 domain-containing protein [Methylomirabilota bacterium]